MRYNALTAVLIGILVLCTTACSTQRSLRHERELKAESVEWKDSVVVQSVEVHDTLREVTTITVDRNDRGDTLRQSIVTDRERVRNAADVRSKTVDVRVVRDTVYIEKRDSVMVSNTNLTNPTNEKKSNFLSILKWTFALICAIIILIIVIKLGLRRPL